MQRPSLIEALGLTPLPERLKQAWIAIAGAEDVPGSRFDLTSLKQLAPRLALPLWRGKFDRDRRAVLTNLFNHRQTPIEDGWSVRKRQVLDFRGKDLTYDSHNGTDFAIPVGTRVVAPAAAKVVRVFAEYNRGGLKLMLDHGGGLSTCSAHLARVLVKEGDVVDAGELVAISGYSGLDALVTFPFGIPHVHFNVWLDGEPVDPFAFADQPSLWIGGFPGPVPTRAPAGSAYQTDRFDADAIARTIEACLTPSVRQRLTGIQPLEQRAHTLISEMNYYPTRFPLRERIYVDPVRRTERLYMPFSAEDIEGAVFYDDR